MNQTKQNGVSRLTDAQEQMRMKVVDLELKARYWKAQYEIKEFSLKSDALAEDYALYVEKEMKKEQEMLEQMQKAMAEQGATMTPADEPEATTPVKEDA